MKKNPTAWWAIAALACALWLPHLLCRGMFIDGIYDALLAQNLYLHVSSFWSPQTIYYSRPNYWDNPPLSMGLLAVAYKILGDHYAVERIYSLACAIAQLGLIALLWKTIFDEETPLIPGANNGSQLTGKLSQYAWLPCLLWLVSPPIAWSYSNNLMENTMCLFTTGAMVSITRFIKRPNGGWLWAFLTAAFLILGFITKGPVSMFVLAMPVLMLYINPAYNIKRAAAFLFLCLLFMGIGFTALLSFEAPRHFFTEYFAVQLKPNLNHQMPGGYVPYKILLALLQACSVGLVLTAIRLALSKKINRVPVWEGVSLRFLLLTLCGSLPIMLSVKQRIFYLLPAMVAAVTGFAIYLLPLFDGTCKVVTRQFTSAGKIQGVIKAISASAIVVSAFLCIYNKGEMIRDKNILLDLKAANDLTRGENVIRADWHLYGEWSLRGYWLRLYRKKLCMPDEQAPAHYYMTKAGEWGDKLPANSPKIYAGKMVDLYKL